jgi:hypothetical protein
MSVIFISAGISETLVDVLAVQTAVQQLQLHLFAFGIGQDASETALRELACAGNGSSSMIIQGAPIGEQLQDEVVIQYQDFTSRRWLDADELSSVDATNAERASDAVRFSLPERLNGFGPVLKATAACYTQVRDSQDGVGLVGVVGTDVRLDEIVAKISQRNTGKSYAILADYKLRLVHHPMYASMDETNSRQLVSDVESTILGCSASDFENLTTTMLETRMKPNPAEKSGAKRVTYDRRHPIGAVPPNDALMEHAEAFKVERNASMTYYWQWTKSGAFVVMYVLFDADNCSAALPVTHECLRNSTEVTSRIPTGPLSELSALCPAIERWSRAMEDDPKVLTLRALTPSNYYIELQHRDDTVSLRGRPLAEAGYDAAAQFDAWLTPALLNPSVVSLSVQHTQKLASADVSDPMGLREIAVFAFAINGASSTHKRSRPLLVSFAYSACHLSDRLRALIPAAPVDEPSGGMYVVLDYAGSVVFAAHRALNASATTNGRCSAISFDPRSPYYPPKLELRDALPGLFKALDSAKLLRRDNSSSNPNFARAYVPNYERLLADGIVRGSAEGVEYLMAPINGTSLVLLRVQPSSPGQDLSTLCGEPRAAPCKHAPAHASAQSPAHAPARKCKPRAHAQVVSPGRGSQHRCRRAYGGRRARSATRWTSRSSW